MAKKGSTGTPSTKEWAKHLKPEGKRDAAKSERKNAKKDIKERLHESIMYNKKFENFLESLKGNGQDNLIESVKTGFRVCFEGQKAKDGIKELMEQFDSDKVIAALKKIGKKKFLENTEKWLDKIRDYLADQDYGERKEKRKSRDLENLYIDLKIAGGDEPYKDGAPWEMFKKMIEKYGAETFSEVTKKMPRNIPNRSGSGGVTFSLMQNVASAIDSGDPDAWIEKAKSFHTTTVPKRDTTVDDAGKEKLAKLEKQYGKQKLQMKIKELGIESYREIDKLERGLKASYSGYQNN